MRGSREIKADEEVRGIRGGPVGLSGLDDDRVWAIEDCRHVSRRLEQALLAAGERVVRVPPHRMGHVAEGGARAGRVEDEIDALAVARAVVKDGVEQIPGRVLDEGAMEIRLLLDHREDLVAERTRTVNRLRWHLLELCPELERSLKRGALNQARELDRVDRQLRGAAGAARGSGSRASRCPSCEAEPPDEAAPLRAARARHGAPPAATGRARLRGADRSDPDRPRPRLQAIPQTLKLRSATGTSPRSPCSSGKRPQHRLNRGGDRQLNHALHIIAITRAQRDPATKEYLARKEAEGKTTKGALRSLKHLARRFYRLLAEAPADQQQASNGEPRHRTPRASDRGRAAGDPAAARAATSDRPDHPGPAPFPMVCIS